MDVLPLIFCLGDGGRMMENKTRISPSYFSSHGHSQGYILDGKTRPRVFTGLTGHCSHGHLLHAPQTKQLRHGHAVHVNWFTTRSNSHRENV